MDFIFFSAVLNCIITWLILSYDIACQYSKNFWTRMEELPEKMHLDPRKTKVWFKVPNFHILGHKWSGVTDGEDVEQNWEFTNGAAGSTKMMGLGTRHAFLEALFSFHNWMRTEGQKDKEAFDSFTELIEAEQPELVEKWRTWVKEWEAEQHDEEALDSPYEMPQQVHTMKKVQLELEKAELASTGDGLEIIERTHTASGFIAMALDVEQSQRILAIDIKALNDPSPLQELAMRTYMPRVERHLPQAQRAIFDDKSRSAENVKLFLPSELPSRLRTAACQEGLVKIEEVREAELKETLEDLRTGLCVRTMTARFRLRNSTGQRVLTRGQGILRLINLHIHKAKLRYRYSQNQYLRLRGHGAWEKEFKVLWDEDNSERGEEAEREKLRQLGAIIEGGVHAAGVLAAGETLHQMSWIWYQTGLTGADDELVDGFFTDAAVARGRRAGRRRNGSHFGIWGLECGHVVRASRGATEESDAGVGRGTAAYAMEHVEREERTCQKLASEWRGLRQRGRDYMAGIPAEHGEKLVVELGEEEPESDDEGDLAGDDEVDGMGENEVDEVDEDD
ncbi:hypothetical protein C8R43DRAFT_963919 [Mycena crocata]|nr:hypothetical protein C8R43DRAFT_963919 [Mycena crocata]